jgi:hypothetical protein
VGHVSRSTGLLHGEASQARVFQSGLKTGGGATAGGARGTNAEVASELSQRRMSRCDRLCRILLPLLCHFRSISPYGHCRRMKLLANSPYFICNFLNRISMS